MNLTQTRTKRQLKAVIVGLSVAASLLTPVMFAQPVLLVDTGGGSGTGQPLFGTGNTTCSPQPACATFYQYLAGQFTLANGATLDSVQGWMSVGGPMSMVVKIYADSSGLPGSIILSKTYPLSSSSTSWKVFSNFNPVLPAGTYWLGFEPANGSNFQAAMPGAAPNPLPNYAFNVNGNNHYVSFATFGQHPGLGFRVSGTTNAPSVVSVTPVNGSGSPQTFSATYSDANGVSDLNAVYLVFNSSLSIAHGCAMIYVPATNGLYLYNDAGSGFVTGFISPGSAGTLSTSQCMIGNAGAATIVGNNLTLPVAITFTAFSGSKNIYALAANNGGLYSNWVNEGTWTPAVSQPPSLVSLTPINGSGLTQTFNATFSEPNGVNDLNAIYIVFNPSLSTARGCLALYLPYANSMYLYNDAGNGFVAGTVSPGTAGTLSNTQCTIGNAGSVTISGTQLTLPVVTTFTSSFSGVKNVYAFALNFENQNSSIASVGTWTSAPSQAPTVVSVAPINGSGSPQTFSATYGEQNGVSDLSVVYLLFNSTLSAAGGCLAVYLPGSNQMYLYNDAGSGFILGTISPGTAGTLSNSQCTLSNAGFATVAGTNLTLPVAITFAASFTGSKTVYGFASNFEGGSTGWQTMGTWTGH